MASELAWKINLIETTRQGLIPLESGLFYDWTLTKRRPYA